MKKVLLRLSLAGATARSYLIIALALASPLLEGSDACRCSEEGGKRHGAHRSKLQLSGALGLAWKPTACVSALEPHRADSHTPPETDPHISQEQQRSQAADLLQQQHRRKMPCYASRGAIGASPWIITSPGEIHTTLKDWALGLKPCAMRAVTTACCKRLASCRAFGEPHTNHASFRMKIY